LAHNARFLHRSAAHDEIDLFRCRFRCRIAGKIYGCARVSTAAQDETGQVRQLKAAGCEKVFREKITGTTADWDYGLR
jgi:resolvase-like protein